MQVSSSRSFLHPTCFNVDNSKTHSRTNFSEQTGRPHLKWHTTFCSNGNSPISHCSCWEFPESPNAVGKPQDCLVFRACSEWHPCKTKFETCALYRMRIVAPQPGSLTLLWVSGASIGKPQPAGPNRLLGESYLYQVPKECCFAWHFLLD